MLEGTSFVLGDHMGSMRDIVGENMIKNIAFINENFKG